jgi:DNA polymerase III delta prime subunit
MVINLLQFQAYSLHTSFSAWKKEHTVFHQTSRPVVLIFCGLPFSGKTTFARALSEETGWIRIDLNKINASRGVGIDGGAITLEEWARSYDESWRQMAAALSTGASIISERSSASNRSVGPRAWPGLTRIDSAGASGKVKS